MTLLMQPGEVVTIPEAQYLYGLGDLVLRVTEVGGVQRMADGDWIPLRGMQLAWNSEELGEREVLVRLGRPGKPRSRTRTR